MNPTLDAPGPPAETVAPTPCDRCGTFASLSPLRGQLLCEACTERVLHPIERAPMGTASLLSGVWEIWRVLWWRALLLVVAFELPFLLITALVPAAQAVDRFSWFVTVLADGALILLVMQVIEGRTVSARGALSEVTTRWGAIIWASLLSNLIIGLFTLLLIVPGVLRALSYLLVLPVVLHDEGRGSDALSSSSKLMEGSRSHVFVTWLVLFLPPLLVLFAYVGVGLWLEGVFTETPSLDGPSPATTALLDVVAPIGVVLALIPLKLLPAVVYAKVRRTASLF